MGIGKEQHIVCHLTGHPLVDVGIAALTAFAGREQPEALTHDDLAHAAAWLDKNYVTGTPLGGVARGILLLNSGYFSEKGRPAYVRRVLYGWLPDTPHLDVPCSFCGQPAVYRANREDIPLLNGREVINFSPAGQAGLPVCGVCSLAFHMLPAGCFKSGAGLVAVHSDDPAVTLACARQNVVRLQRELTLNTEKLPGLPHTKTRLAELLVSQMARRRAQPASLTAYFFSNNGADPFIKIYRVDACALSFLDEVLHPDLLEVKEKWDEAVERAWADPQKRKKAEAPGEGNEALRPNRLYEALLALPDGAADFLRRFLLPTKCWALVEIYLRKVLNMQESDIALLRDVGARLAEYARHKNRFFYDFSRTNDYAQFRRVVLRAADDAARADGQPLIAFDEFIRLFTYREGEYWDWRLARDLIVLLMIEARVPHSDEALLEEPSAAGEAQADSEY